MRDSYGRTIDYMRISVTDRCNLRCRYCMPEGIEPVPANEILTFEEIELICKAAIRLGITKFKITGGEPLVRPGCPELVGRIRRLPGTEQVTLTTNGILLGKYLEALRENGLDGVNVSLDTLQPSVYEKITGYDGVEEVKENIRKAAGSGLAVKINSVLQRGLNDEEWGALAALTLAEKVDVRFIEMMPIGYGKQCEGVSGVELLQKLKERYPGLCRDTSVHGNGPAVYYRIPGAAGSVGFISAIHGRFCDSCNRIRLTAEGELKPCLCYKETVDVRSVIRNAADRTEIQPGYGDGGESVTEQVEKAIVQAIIKKPGMHCFQNSEDVTELRKMVQIGG